MGLVNHISYEGACVWRRLCGITEVHRENKSSTYDERTKKNDADDGEIPGFACVP